MTALRVLLAGSVPLAAPWNGADKNLARLLVEHDLTSSYIVHTSVGERFARRDGLRAVRSRRARDMPTARQRVASAAFVALHGHEADLVHLVATLHSPSRGVAAAVAGWSRIARRPLLHTIPSLGEDRVDRSRLPSANIVVVSEHSRAALLRAGVPTVHRIHPPLAPRTVHAAGIAAGRARHRLGCRAILCATHYGDDNGIAELLRAFAGLTDDVPEGQLVLACRRHPWQDEAVEAARLEEAARSHGVGDRVRVVTRVPDMAELIAACAITVLVPHRLHAKMDLPLIVLESLMLERPVIVSDRPPIAEALLGGGIAVPPGNVEALRAALAQLLTDDDLRRRLAATGAEQVRRLCAPERVVAAYHAIYDETVMEGPASRWQS
jgi:glycosyltransferase involved in cell wall biosynthesis